MPTPLAHGVAAWATVRTAPSRTLSPPRLFALAAFLAVAPDLDFLLGALLRNPDGIHRGATHSIVGAAIASLAIAWVLSRGATGRVAHRRGTRWWFAVVMPAWCAHIALDLVVPDTNGATGMRLFWPFSNEYIGLPIPLPPAVRAFIDLETATGPFGFVTALLSPRGLAVLVLEGLAFTPLLLTPRLVDALRLALPTGGAGGRSRPAG